MGKEKRSEYGARLFAARKNAGLTQAQLATAAGIKQPTIAELEKFGQGSTHTTRLALALRVDPEWLANGVGAAPLPVALSAPTLEQAVDVLIGALERLDEQSHKVAVEKLQDSARAPDSKLLRARLLDYLRNGASGDAPKKSNRPTGTDDPKGAT